MAGIGESLLLVSFCGLCTFLTGISLSAIATNGAMKVEIVCKQPIAVGLMTINL